MLINWLRSFLSTFVTLLGSGPAGLRCWCRVYAGSEIRFLRELLVTSIRRNYNAGKALDILNGYLQRKGYALLLKDGFLVCVNVDKGIPPNLIPDVAVDDLLKVEQGIHKIGERTKSFGLRFLWRSLMWASWLRRLNSFWQSRHDDGVYSDGLTDYRRHRLQSSSH